MASAKVVSMHVRPFQVTHLCFEVDGIIKELDTELGATVTPFNYTAFYSTLGSAPTVAGDFSRLLYDPAKIQAFVSPYALVMLRAETGKAALTNAINARQNSFFAKYANAPAIISATKDSYSPNVPNSKYMRLLTLRVLSDKQADDLKSAYINDARTGVVTSTYSYLNSMTESSEYSNNQSIETNSETSGGTTTETGQSDQEAIVQGDFSGSWPDLPTGGGPLNVPLIGPPCTATESIQHSTSGGKSTTTGSATGQRAGSQFAQSTGAATQTQAIINTDYGYRIPYIECQAQNERAQISLIDQQFEQLMFAQTLPNLGQIYDNELNTIDNNVYRLQVAYLNSILMSPIPGVVTGLYKHPGDAAKAGEPIVRVENNQTVLLQATLVYRGPISIGSSVTVETTLFDVPGPPTTVTGSVVAARGRRDDDLWEVIVKCNNLDNNNKPVLPLGYNFDYDDTTVSII